MAKSADNTVLDALLDQIKNNADKMTLCNAQPTTFTEADATFMLANVAMAPTDFTIADGITSGRRVTVGSKAGVTVATTGNATHIALVDTTSSVLLFVTTIKARNVTAAATVDFPQWDIEISDPA